MKKRILALLLTALMLVASVVPASAADVVLGVVRYTQIVAYIDGYPIRSYNINDNTYIVVEDLVEYGFGVVWDGATGRLLISPERTAAPANYTTKYKAPAVTQAMINSEIAMNYYETKVTTWIGPNQINGFNIGGYTCIFMDDLARFFAAPGGYAWVPEEKALKMVSPAFGTSTPSEPAPEAVPAELERAISSYIDGDIAAVKNRQFTGADAKLMADFKAVYGDKLQRDYFALLDEYNATVKYVCDGAVINGNTAEVGVRLTSRDMVAGARIYQNAAEPIVWGNIVMGKSLETTEFLQEIMVLMIETLGDDNLPTATRKLTVTLTKSNGTWVLDEAKNADFITALTGGLYDNLIPPSANKAA